MSPALARAFASSSAAGTRKRAIRIVEVSPRDGLQNEKRTLPASLKIELIDRLVRAGCRTIEAGSFVSPKWVPQMGTTSEVVSSPTLKALRSRFSSPELTLPCLVPNVRGLASYEALPPEAKPVVDEIALFAATTDAFSKANTNATVLDMLKSMEKVVERAQGLGLRIRGYVSCAVGCPYSGDVDPGKAGWLTRELVDMGCYEVSVADTTGVGSPRQIRAVVEACVAAGVPVEKLAIHCHDTFGMGLANVLAAVELGVPSVDASVGGIGGCPYSPGALGNVSTEDVVYGLETAGYSTGLLGGSPSAGPLGNEPERLSKLEELAGIGHWVNKQLERPNSSRVGKAVLARRAQAQAQEAAGRSKL